MVDLSKGSSDTAVPEGKGKKRWVKYVIIAAVVLGIIGSLEDGGDESGSSQTAQETQQNGQVEAGSGSVTEQQEGTSTSGTDQTIQGEQEKMDTSGTEQTVSEEEAEEEIKSLTEKEQKDNVNSLLDSFEESGEVTQLENAELYDEKNVYSCMNERMKKFIEKEINEDSIEKCLDYQQLYLAWYPNGEHKKDFENLKEQCQVFTENTSKMNLIDDSYSGSIEKAYDFLLEYCVNADFYVRYEVDQSFVDSIVDFFSGENNIYYYANDIVYDDFSGYDWGDEEYLICVEDTLRSSGAQSFYGYFGDPIAVEFTGGFERNLPVFEVISDQELITIDSQYENYLQYKKKKSKSKKEIEKIITGKTTAKTKPKVSNVSYMESEYVLPDSDTEKLTKRQVLNLTKKQRWIAKNEIYARHGRLFQNEELQDYFNSTSWYAGIIEPEDFDESVFNKTEKANIRLLAEYEKK